MQTVESEQCSACTQAMHTAPAEKQSICSGLADRLFLLFSVFAIGASFGWVLEVCYRSLVAGHFVNPGFLHGPYLPIYGTGLVLIDILNWWQAKKPGHRRPLRFLASVLLQTLAAGLIEFATGFFFLRVFGLRLWDYSSNFGNLFGIICPSFLLAWAVLCALYTRFLHVNVRRAAKALIAHRVGMFLLGCYCGVLLVDAFFSFWAAWAGF